MQKTGLTIVNNEVVLRRVYYYEEVDQQSNTYDANNPTTWKAVGKTVTFRNTIDIATDGFEILTEWFSEENKFSYCAWVKNASHVYYFSISNKTKTVNQPIVKRVSIKPPFFNEIEVIDKYFIKTKAAVFYVGKKVNEASALSFSKVENTHFYTDTNFVYSFTITNGLAKIAIPIKSRFFISYCWYFANKETIYTHSGWSNKIEPITGKLDTASTANMSEVLIKNAVSTDENIRRELFDSIKTYEDLFNFFYPYRK